MSLHTILDHDHDLELRERREHQYGHTRIEDCRHPECEYWIATKVDQPTLSTFVDEGGVES